MTPRTLTISHWEPDRSEPLLELTLGDLLRQVASEVPDRVALVDGGAPRGERRRWTYRELLAESERAARALLARFRPGERVAICAANCPEWIVLQHALHLAGLVLVPMNPAYRDAEMEVILRSCGAAGIFHAERFRRNEIAAAISSLREKLPGLRETIPVSDLAAFVERADPDIELPKARARDLLQLQYTSGTTGVPKGAQLHHHGAINTSRFVAARAGFPDGGVWLNAMPLFHIGGPVVTAMGTLSRRGTYVIAPGFDPQQMLELVESERATITLVVPTMILALLDHPDFSKRDLSSLRTIMSGATAVPAALVERTKKALGCDFTICFGQTELNGVVTQTSPADTVEDQAETLGRPLPQSEVAILASDTGEIVPIGATGEICVRGYQTMHGYHGLDEATRATIREDGWLRTGDLGTMDSRGYLRIAGRLKDMIIRGGMNLYPREIEDVLFEHPAVAQVAVVGVPDERLGEVVGAVVQPRIPGELPCASLHAFCRERLAVHKAPVFWYAVDQFPLTPSGKIQKFVLQNRIAKGELRPVPWERSA